MSTEGGGLVAAELQAAFAQSFGHEPAGVWAAPGRVNLIGEHTDYNEGFALPLALPQRVAVAASARDDGVLRVRSRTRPAEPVSTTIAGLTPGSVTGWGAYVAGVAWALRTSGYAMGGADMLVDADLAPGSGLASSAALECASAVALDELWSLEVPREELAMQAQRAESVFVGMPCGIMDQTASLMCTAGHALLLDCRDGTATPVPVDLRRRGHELVVIDTRAPHRLVDGEYSARRRKCEQAAAALGVRALRDIAPERLAAALQRVEEPSRGYVRHVVTENARVLQALQRLREDDLGGMGKLLTESHASLRDDYEVSCPELDTAVEAALEAGARGARMTGAGFGGCAIALADAERVDAVAAGTKEAYADRGFSPPRIFTAAASAGAARIH